MEEENLTTFYGVYIKTREQAARLRLYWSQSLADVSPAATGLHKQLTDEEEEEEASDA